MSGQNMIDNKMAGGAPNLPNPAGGEPNPDRDPDELTDEELEWVVGGTDPEFARSQFEQLQKPLEPPTTAS